jgi:eukaryotic-like serine/threonine-protein kinase
VQPVSEWDQPTFEQCALASGLLTQQQLDEARAGVRWSEEDEPDANAPPSDQQVADRLVETGLLNAWQARQLLDGRTKFNLGSYLIVDSIGKGGMGQVFKAKHEKIGRIVAVKVLPRDRSTPEAIASFTREIRALASLDHPKLVAAMDAGQDGNVYYLVTEYIPGTDLRKLVRREGPLAMASAAAVISQVAEGLAYAHQQGIIHRDIKPGNVLVAPDGIVKLSDLGLAGSLTAQPETDPRHGKVVGTADYVSPDHVRDPWTPTPAWDIYSLGCTLYYAVTGKVPFPGGTTADKARAHCELRPLDPRRLNPRLNAEFVEIMADMMAKDPAQRTASAAEVIERLRPFLPTATEPAVAFSNPTEKTPGQSPVLSAGVLPLPPPIIMPPTVSRPVIRLPEMGPAAMRSQGSRAETALSDTQVDLPHRPAVIDEDSSSSEIVETVTLSASGPDKSRSADTPVPPHDDFTAVLWPLTVFVLAPLAVVGTVLLLWHLVRAIF